MSVILLTFLVAAKNVEASSDSNVNDLRSNAAKADDEQDLVRFMKGSDNALNQVLL
jgi:hypothetical protein